jgi:putative ABC transport system permease protein
MNLKKSLELALNILLHSKLRSWLTIIGIIIGIGAVVSIVSISQGAQAQLQSRLGDLGANVLTITPGVSRAQGFGGGFRNEGDFGQTTSATNKVQKNITARDTIVLKNINNVQEVMGTVSAKGTLTYQTKSATVSVTGVDTAVWNKITTETIAQGRTLITGDAYSVVLGGNIVSKTFDGTIPLNGKVTIEGKTFNVVGILDGGNSVYMPIDQARTTFDTLDDKSFSSISVKINDVSISNTTATLIEEKLMFERGILKEADKDFTVENPSAMQETMQETMDTMAIFLGAIAAISLLVGAIGIANTMFTSVLEKTKEIGIMKAIGAKNKDILVIFLLNSGLIGLVGGIGGIILGVFGSSMISAMTSSSGTGGLRMFGSTSITPQLLIFSLLFAIIIGMVSGIIPAYRASRLNPVDALRSE